MSNARIATDDEIARFQKITAKIDGAARSIAQAERTRAQASAAADEDGYLRDRFEEDLVEFLGKATDEPLQERLRKLDKLRQEYDRAVQLVATSTQAQGEAAAAIERHGHLKDRYETELAAFVDEIGGMLSPPVPPEYKVIPTADGKGTTRVPVEGTGKPEWTVEPA